MTLLVLQDAALTKLDVQFRQSPFALLIVSLVFFSLVAATGYWYWCGDLPLPAALFCGGFMFVMGLLPFGNFKRALAPTNWVLAVGPGRVLVKFRSYLNAHLPTGDLQVVLLDPSEITSARMTRQRIKAPGRRGCNETSFHTFLDLYVPSVDLAPIRERIKYEWNLKPQKIGKYTRLKARHYPVSVVGSDTVRIEWPSSWLVIAPGIQRALALLARQGITVESAGREVIDLTEKGKKGLDKSEDKILFLAERGHLVAATRFARRTYGLGVTEARQFVEDLLE